MSDVESMSLSWLVEHLAMAGPRDEAFVRALSTWLYERTGHLRLSIVERLGLRDVVVTFKMRDHVRLLITGYPPEDHPGEVTVAVDERDFPFVQILVQKEPCPDPYEFCTLDYSWEGRRVCVTSGEYAGRKGTVVVAATVGRRQENRVRLDAGGVVTLQGEVLEVIERQ